VLGVVEHPLSGFAEVGDRVADHRQVLFAAHLGHLLQVQSPGLPDQGDHRGEAGGEQLQGLVLGGFRVTPPGHPEGADHRLAELDLGQRLEELTLLRVRAREARLDEADPEIVELADDAHLLLGRERHALALHAVPQSRVVELYFSPLPCLRFRGERARYRWPLSGRGGGNSPDLPE
jgi:hypothetical protein